VTDTLAEYGGLEESVVLALPRGGVPIGREIAGLLAAPLGVFFAKKITSPISPELALGAVTHSGESYTNDNLVQALGISPSTLIELKDSAKDRLEHSALTYQSEDLPQRFSGLSVVVCDDGAATGATMAVAIQAILAMAPKRLVVALPVASEEAHQVISHALAAAPPRTAYLICPLIPADFSAVGQWYQTFPQLSDQDVLDILHEAKASTPRPMQSVHPSLAP
jgi:putative phosphoribosyl transferase